MKSNKEVFKFKERKFVKLKDEFRKEDHYRIEEAVGRVDEGGDMFRTS